MIWYLFFFFFFSISSSIPTESSCVYLIYCIYRWGATLDTWVYFISSSLPSVFPFFYDHYPRGPFTHPYLHRSGIYLNPIRWMIMTLPSRVLSLCHQTPCDRDVVQPRAIHSYSRNLSMEYN
ncbi:hypothetical protein F4778DRAFT_721403 [Xylariomycetidae sp. FL2044]|nr:hypothetical protein F4778DRAFT_721403 [Xylariomycetidae sp. FL2044]